MEVINYIRNLRKLQTVHLCLKLECNIQIRSSWESLMLRNVRYLKTWHRCKFLYLRLNFEPVRISFMENVRICKIKNLYYPWEISKRPETGSTTCKSWSFKRGAKWSLPTVLENELALLNSTFITYMETQRLTNAMWNIPKPNLEHLSCLTDGQLLASREYTAFQQH